MDRVRSAGYINTRAEIAGIRRRAGAGGAPPAQHRYSSSSLHNISAPLPPPTLLRLPLPVFAREGGVIRPHPGQDDSASPGPHQAVLVRVPTPSLSSPAASSHCLILLLLCLGQVEAPDRHSGIPTTERFLASSLAHLGSVESAVCSNPARFVVDTKART